MFGNSDKEYYKNKHEQELKIIEAKGEIFKSAFLNATDETVTISNYVLRKSFIQLVEKRKSGQGVMGTFIHYFNFDLKSYNNDTVRAIFIEEADLSFDQITTILESKNV